MLRIGDFSKIARVTIKTLRYYDKIGLLKPAFIDTHTGYRYYTEEQVSKMHAILSYKKAGLSNADIKTLLSKQGDSKQFLLTCKDKLEKELKTLINQISYVEKLLEESEENSYAVCVKKVANCKAFCCCGYVNTIEQIPTFIKNCHLEIKKTNPNIRFPEPDYCCVIYPHNEYRESDIFIEYAQSVAEMGQESEIVKFKELEEVCVVSITHFGRYDTLSNAYLRAVEWAKENGYVLRGDVRERYVHGAWDREQENEWETEVQLPILPVTKE